MDSIGSSIVLQKKTFKVRGKSSSHGTDSPLATSATVPLLSPVSPSGALRSFALPLAETQSTTNVVQHPDSYKSPDRAAGWPVFLKNKHAFSACPTAGRSRAANKINFPNPTESWPPADMVSRSRRCPQRQSFNGSRLASNPPRPPAPENSAKNVRFLVAGASTALVEIL